MPGMMWAARSRSSAVGGAHRHVWCTRGLRPCASSSIRGHIELPSRLQDIGGNLYSGNERGNMIAASDLERRKLSY